jgi:hypothetical protein|tara:strand:+ start:76 stop:729 length:654 start_codon:yes stop_codon:yes gene_type:complete
MEKKKNTKDLINNYLQSEEHKKHNKFLEDKRKTIKRGANVLHLQHLGEFSDKELKELNNKLLNANLELSSYNKSGDTFAMLDTYELVSYFVIHQQLIKEILKSVGTSAIWDAVKWSLLFGWKKLRNEKYYKLNSTTKEEKKLIFGVSVKLDENTGFDFELNGSLSNEIIETSIDKVLDFMREQKKNTDFKLNNYVNYSETEKKWNKVDVMDELNKNN